MAHAPRLSLTLAILAGGIPLLRAEDTPPAKPAPAQAVQTLEVTVTGNVGGDSGPVANPNGANTYSVSGQDIENLPLGANTTFTDMLAQMPGVAIDQYQLVHIRDTEGAGFQYQLNGILIPVDINTNPPFMSMLNPMFIEHVDLLDGVVPARYSYAMGGILDIQTKDGFAQNGGSESTMVGQRQTIQQSAQYGGSAGNLSFYVNGMAGENNMGFSSATPGPNAYHDHEDIGQAFGYFTYRLSDTAKLSLTLSTSASNNQLPNVPDMPQQFTLAGYNAPNSSDINSGLNMRDYLGILALNVTPSKELSYQIAVVSHSISQAFYPDNNADLVYQGVSPSVTRSDLDFTAQGDVTWKKDATTTYSSGFYLGSYRINSRSSTLVFPVDANGNQTSTTPLPPVDLRLEQDNIVTGLYVNDNQKLSDAIGVNAGVRWDTLSGFTHDSRLDPTISLTYKASPSTDMHAGFQTYMQVPTFSGIPVAAPSAFANTTNQQLSGGTLPECEHDLVWDAGINNRPFKGGSLSWDSFFELTHHYLDAGLFGEVPIDSPINYDHGIIWGSEIAFSYREGDASFYANYSMGQNYEKGVDTGQFNFQPDDLAYINSHYFLLDHEPLAELSSGITYQWRPLTFSLDAVYSSGLRTSNNYVDDTRLPTVFQVNAGVLWAFSIPWIGQFSNRVTILDLFDKINLIRPQGGIGIFQSSYGPRFTVYDTLTYYF
jgi:outer membrane cobalamin receptor